MPKAIESLPIALMMRWLVVVLTGVLAACSTIRTARPSTEPRPEPSPVIWPKLPGPTRPTVKVLHGQPPQDLGRVKGWHVTEIGQVENPRSFILSRKPRADSAQAQFKIRYENGDAIQEIEVSGYLKWMFHAHSLTTVKRGTLVLLGSFYAGNYGLKQGIGLIKKMNQEGWDVVWSSVDPNQFNYRQGKQKDDLPQVAEKLARQLDEAIAWEAEAVDAVLTLLAKERDLATLPRPLVYFGVSAGAMVVPALAARSGRPDATILVSGSASVGELLFSTSLPTARAAIQLPNEDLRSKQARHSLAKLTRQNTGLDPEKLASHLRGSPVLLITSGQDRIVPTRLQRELDTALGRPERWHRWGGHSLTIYRLPTQWPRLAAWLQKTTQSYE